MPTLFPGSSPSYPPEDLHSKLQVEIPYRSKTDTMNSVVRAFSASKTLHQVLGMREPEPFAPPPPMPNDLIERIEAELQEYEQLRAAGLFVPKRAKDPPASVLSRQGKTSLADILEEKESSVRTTPTRLITAGTSEKLTINLSKWTSEKQAVAVAQRYMFLDSDRDAANDAASEYTDCKFDDEDYSSWKYGSSLTLAVSDYSRAGSSASDNETVPVPSFPPRTSSLLPLNHDYDSNGIDPHASHPINKKLPPRLLPTSTHPTAPANSQHPYKKVYSFSYSNRSTSGRTESLPVLFPSLGVEQQSQDFRQTEHGSVHRNVSSDVEPHNAFHDAILDPNGNTASSTTPRITIQPPSPVKAPTSKKRAPPSSARDGFGPPLSQRARRDEVAGLPVLPPGEEAVWESKFPGNTHALLTILLTWSRAMWAFRHRLPDPKLFLIHPAFPYPVTPPIRKQLLSVSFYDTSVEPHKEIRFLGPGDVAEMIYHEVEVFGVPESNNDSPLPRCSSPIDTIKQTLGLVENEAPKHVRYMSMPQRAKTGEGRWCYVLIKGAETQDGGIPPHVILAWHISAVTATSDCLHTIYADDVKSQPVASTQSKLKRFSSLQNFGLALRSPAKLNLHQSLRSASSSSELPSVDADTQIDQRGSTTLHRTVLKLEKAGNIPLIEGYRVDVAAFRGWLDACGKGIGKVIMWRERNGR